MNEPYDPKEGVCHALDSFVNYKMPDIEVPIEGVLLEYRNDYCSDPVFRRHQAELMSEVIKSLHI